SPEASITFARIIRTYNAANNTANVIHGNTMCHAHCTGPPHPVDGLKKSQYPVIGVQPNLNPTTYDKINPIHTGRDEIPINTNTIEPLSSNDRGRNADKIPIGNAINIHNTAPPNTNDAVTGAAFNTVVFTL